VRILGALGDAKTVVVPEQTAGSSVIVKLELAIEVFVLIGRKYLVV